MAVQEWINNREVITTTLEVLSDLEEWGIYTALEEQQQIGWNNFFKGRISSKFRDIQMSTYNAEESIDPVPLHYSAMWWTIGLIKEMIYMSLNLWQHRNRFLHDT